MAAIDLYWPGDERDRDDYTHEPEQRHRYRSRDSAPEQAPEPGVVEEPMRVEERPPPRGRDEHGAGHGNGETEEHDRERRPHDVVEYAVDAPTWLVAALAIPATVGEFWMIAYLLVVGIRPAAERLLNQ